MRRRSSPFPLAAPWSRAWTRRLSVAAIGCWALLAVAAAPPAFGHVAFLESNPGPGVRVEVAPDRVTLDFTEPLNRPLSTATLTGVPGGKRVAATSTANARRQIELVPGAELARGAYRVKWHTVSTIDGHALEGSFSFGVRAEAPAGQHSIEQSPLARNGWLRIAARWLLYASLLFFAGGVLNSALLARREQPGAWLAPGGAGELPKATATGPASVAARAWERTLDAGWLAAGAAAAVAVVEAADASGGLGLRGLGDFLLTNQAGLARVGTILALVLAALAAARRPVAASAALALAFGTIAISGHANSADEARLAAVTSDWVHLLAAAVWVGGIAQIAAAWLPVLRGAGRELRRRVARTVLERFGRVGLPAFLVVVAAGVVNALIQLGAVSALWQTAYGQVLAAKVALVGLIAGASYWHAMRLRPRLLAANLQLPARLEHRHWRLLGAEPVLAVGVVAAVAALVAFPLPPRQLQETAEAGATAPCDPCPLPRAGPGELAVAEQAGTRIAAFWLRPAGAGLAGTVRLLDLNAKPVPAPVRLRGARLRPCGRGCWRFRLPRAPRRIELTVQGGKRHLVSVPGRWDRAREADARRLVATAQRAMRDLRSARLNEVVTSGFPGSVRTSYRFKAPDRMAYRNSSGTARVFIGRYEYGSEPGSRPVRNGFPGGFRLRGFFRWTPYARSVGWLGSGRERGRAVARISLFDPATPVWFTLSVDARTNRVLSERLIAGGHFMDRRYFGFNAPLRIEAPAGAERR